MVLLLLLLLLMMIRRRRRRRMSVSMAVGILMQHVPLHGNDVVQFVQLRQVVALQEVLDGILELLKRQGGLRLPRRVLVDELLRKVVRDAMDAALDALCARRLAWLHKAFDLVSLALGALGSWVSWLSADTGFVKELIGSGRSRKG
jgi:hypothetical protein